MALSDEIDAYSAYLNGLPRATREYEPEALAEYVEDLEKAKAQLERAYLEAGYEL